VHDVMSVMQCTKVANFCIQVTLRVGMSCQGCVGAVERVLKKMAGSPSSPPPSRLFIS